MPRIIQDSWIREYLRFTEDTESPSMFHFWVAVSVVASVLNRNVFIDQGFFTVYPHFYIILVAASQECRKTSAINQGEKILRKLPNPPKILSQKMTPEALIEGIQPNARESESGVVSANAVASMIAGELAVFVDRDAHRNGLIALLVDLFDCKEEGIPWEYRTKKRGVEQIYNNCLNLLAGSSPEYLRLSLPQEEIGGGFTARTILVYQDKPKRRIPYPAFGPEHKEMQDRLIKDLHHMSQLKGEIKVTPKGREWYAQWYMERDTSDLPPGLEPYYIKKAEHLFALAIVLSMAESDELTVTPVHLQTALEFLEENELLMPNAMEGISLSVVGQDTSLVLKAINKLHQEKGYADRTTLLRRLWRHMDAASMSNHIDTLAQAGLITESRKPKGGAIYVPSKPGEPPGTGKHGSSKD